VITVGSKAPDFSLKDQNKKTVRLSKFPGKKVLLSFRPLAWTPVCRDQMKSLDENYRRFEALNTVALGIGVDSVPSNKAWADVMEIEHTSLLSDFWPHGEVARLYKVFDEENGFAQRANIIVDEKQRVIFAKTYPTSELPEVEEVIKFLGEKRAK
jgi:peroxiredoxin